MPAQTNPRARVDWRSFVVRAPDWALFGLIVVAPLFGGSSHPVMLPILSALVAVACLRFLRAARPNETGSVRVPALALGIASLAVFCGLQIVPLPVGLASVVSQVALDVRRMVDESLTTASISYEPAATAREGAKLLLLALIVLCAADQTRRSGNFRPVAVSIVVAGLASAAVALVHRGFGVDRMLGVLPAAREARHLLTTFVNPNHAAGLMAVATTCSIGLAIRTRRRGEAAAFVAAACVCSAVAVFTFSRGGIIALVGGVVVAVLLALRATSTDGRRPWRTAAGVLGVVGVSTAVVIARDYGELVRQFAGSDADPLSLSAKMAALKDMWGMLLDHPWTGVGRGAFLSAYTKYKTSAFQVTFTHPENIVGELVGDFGFVVGVLAVLGLGISVFSRLVAAPCIVSAAAMAGVAAITLQNMVDFSFEILGVAIPVAAVLGAATAHAKRPRGFRMTHPRAVLGAVHGVLAFLGLGIVGSYALGDLKSDQVELARLSEAARTSQADLHSAALAIVRRHPANAPIIANVAYLAEQKDVPDFERALLWIDHALRLAPTYADAHVVKGRILTKLGRREEGFVCMNRAWTLSQGTPLEIKVIDEIVRHANKASEVIATFPRRGSTNLEEGVAADEAQEIDGKKVALLLRQMRTNGREQSAKAVLVRITRHFEEISSDGLLALSQEVAALRAPEWAMRLLERRRDEAPDDFRAQVALLDVALTLEDYDRIFQGVGATPWPKPADRADALRIGIYASIKQGDVVRARGYQDELSHTLVPTVYNQLLLADLEAKIEIRSGNSSNAVVALDRALALAPANPTYRLQRAELLMRLGRIRQSEADVDWVLRQTPDQPEARRIKAAIEEKKKR